MKTKMKQELKNADIGELRKKLKDAHKALAQARLDHTQFKLKNTSSLTNTRQEIAVLKTILTQKETYGQNA